MSRWGLLGLGVVLLGVAGAARAQEAELSTSGSETEPEVQRGWRPRCERVRFDVRLQPASRERYQVVGSLCTRGRADGRAVQVLLSGATYAKDYWDFPYGGERYSYVATQTALGFVTLSLDRIGSGESDRPPAAEVTSQASAYVVHQVIQALRGGDLQLTTVGRVRADKIVLVGHSLGSAIAAMEAATYDDVDGVIFSGVLHGQGTQANAFANSLMPATQDAAFAHLSIPDGYLTTAPQLRGALFYRPSTSESRVIAEDEEHKSTVTLGELSDASAAAALTAAVRVPVLVAVGDEDFTYCAEPSCTMTGAIDREHDFYPASAHVSVIALPRAGHAINLHRNATLWYRAAAFWALLHVGLGDGRN